MPAITDQQFRAFILHLNDMGLNIRSGYLTDGNGRVYASITSDRSRIISAVTGQSALLSDVGNPSAEFNPATGILLLHGEKDFMIQGRLPDPKPSSPGSSGEALSMPTDVARMTWALNECMPELVENLYYDELRENFAISDTFFSGEPGSSAHPLDDNLLIKLTYEANTRLVESGYTKGPFRKTVFVDTIKNMCLLRRVNPFRDWLNHLSNKKYEYRMSISGNNLIPEPHTGWDGKRRLRRWFYDLLGAHIPGREFREGDRLSTHYVEEVTQAWFLGAVARAYRTEQKHEVLPIFMSLVQGVGKGSALYYTAGKDEFYASTTVPMAADAKFIESVEGAIIVELEEITSLKESTPDKIKAFLSKTRFQFRRPYAPLAASFNPRYIMAGTTNEHEFLSDPTGARRMYPIECSSSQVDRGDARTIPVGPHPEEGGPLSPHQYEVEQVWLEALHMYLEEGLTPDVPKDDPMFDEACTIAREAVEVDIPDYNGVKEWVDDPLSGFAFNGSAINLRLYCDTRYGIDIKTARPSRELEAIKREYDSWSRRAMAKSEWKHVQVVTAHNPTGGSITLKNALIRLVAPGQTSTRNGRNANIVSGYSGGPDALYATTGAPKARNWYAYFRNMMRDQGVSELGSPIALPRLPLPDLTLLEQAGWIYYEGKRTGRPRLGIPPGPEFDKELYANEVLAITGKKA